VGEQKNENHGALPNEKLLNPPPPPPDISSSPFATRVEPRLHAVTTERVATGNHHGILNDHATHTAEQTLLRVDVVEKNLGVKPFERQRFSRVSNLAQQSHNLELCVFDRLACVSG
jgi:hypothetical protein